MREIKFRQWDIERKEYDHAPDFMSNDLYSVLNCEYYITEQFTGLRDKNGKDIYEGDIIQFNDWISDNPQYRSISQVLWYNEKCSLIPQDISMNNRGGRYIHHWDTIIDIEVIGNIHESPELLK